MLRLSMLTGLAMATIGIASLSSGPASAACLNQTLPPITLAHNAMVPNAGYEYDKKAYDAQLAKGNFCSSTQQSYAVTGSPNVNNHDEPAANVTSNADMR